MTAALAERFMTRLPGFSYRLALNGNSGLEWHTNIDGRTVVGTSEPPATLQRLSGEKCAGSPAVNRQTVASSGRTPSVRCRNAGTSASAYADAGVRDTACCTVIRLFRYERIVTGKTGNPRPGPESIPEHPGVRWRHKYRRALKISTVVLVAHLLGLATSMHALMTSRTAPGATAWIVALNATPYLAVPAYWVFGRSKFQDYISLRREVAASLKETLEQELASLKPFRTSWSADGHQTFRAVEKLARLHFVDGNRVELLINGERTFASIFEGIEAAKDYLLVQFYIVRNDEQGRQFQRRLIERAREGVRIYLLLDEIGSGKLSRSYIDELTEAGVEVRWFRSNRGWTNKFQLNFRNHRKLVVADGDLTNAHQKGSSAVVSFT